MLTQDRQDRVKYMKICREENMSVSRDKLSLRKDNVKI